MKSRGDVKGHAFILVNALAVKITFLRDSVMKLDHNRCLQRWLTCSSASSVRNVGKDEILLCNGFAD